MNLLLPFVVGASLLGQNTTVIVPDAASVAEGTISGAWRVEDGVIIGRAEAGETGWLRFAGDYWDFALELEFLTANPANGGVQVRGHWLPASPGTGENPKAMHGYHVNLDTTTAGGTGAILIAHGAPPLSEGTADAQDAIVPGAWNTLSISAQGPVIQVLVNGVPAATSYDEKFIGGMIALQILGGQNGPAEIAYRNIRLTPGGRAEAWTPLFDGATLTGWQLYGTERWSVADGVIQGRRGPAQSEGYLATIGVWTDFRVRGEFRMLGDGNYGLFYHSTITLRDDGYPVIAGVQGEVEPSYPGSTGWLYESYRRGWLVQPSPAEIEAYLLRPGGWNAIEIRSQGNHITTWVNGMRVLDFMDPAPQLFTGSFALQLHTGEGAGIDWRGLYVTAP